MFSLHLLFANKGTSAQPSAESKGWWGGASGGQQQHKEGSHGACGTVHVFNSKNTPSFVSTWAVCSCLPSHCSVARGGNGTKTHVPGNKRFCVSPPWRTQSQSSHISQFSQSSWLYWKLLVLVSIVTFMGGHFPLSTLSLVNSSTFSALVTIPQLLSFVGST